MGQMIALGLETVLIRNVVQGVGLAIGSNPADGTAHTERLLVGTGVLQLSLLLAGNSITGLVAETLNSFEWVLLFERREYTKVSILGNIPCFVLATHPKL